MAGIMGGTCPAGGINPGPAMASGYLVGCNAARDLEMMKAHTGVGS